ncbi:efflux RND transporter periplasmic adaptor subunit [Adhaeribacter rhizoryzae]|uniref:HlyD family efflux transporter periplasmic adaptor subunit n=1 Tax=Adhaeribacter rhizoryzae TaxID=2607907 RepID=A0A5M6DBV2_9BACT|nr:efflux RND transporter periplasmic adaptor subunit [Adhaeribacter rhizoryzae]KAA5544863.1 HlyD family efflux transporter periplasmic adaptor subunit [Adhaeribacter rhizoryzae]
MKKNLRNKILLLLVLWLPLFFTGCQNNHNHTAAEAGTTYTCPMHPQIIKNEPGSCPICNMDLVPIQPHDTKAVPIATDLKYLLQPTNQTIIANIKTVTPITKAVESEITLPGIITYDTRRQYSIPARFGGRIERLLVQYNYQPVRKGQKLFEIYSPELVTAQQELIYLLQNDAQNTELIRGAKQKLKYLGVTDSQINQISKQQKASYTFPVYSPYNGYVVDPAITAAPTAVAPATSTGSGTGGSNMDGMGSGVAGNSTTSATVNPAATPAAGFSIREGMYVNTGQTLLSVINAEEVWAEFNVGSTEAANLKKGTPITLIFNQTAAKPINTQVHLIQPFYAAGESFAKVRALLPGANKAALVGQLITGKIAYATGTALWVPKAAVLDLGNTAVVFRKIDGAFQPTSITVGQRTDDLIEVQTGLEATTQIAGNAQFLVDSESFIRVAENQ